MAPQNLHGFSARAWMASSMGREVPQKVHSLLSDNNYSSLSLPQSACLILATTHDQGQ